MTVNTDNTETFFIYLVQFSAMVFGVTAPEIALQTMAETFGGSTFAVGRIITTSGLARVLVENSQSVKVRAGWSACEDTPKDHFIELSGGDVRDVLIVQTSTASLSKDQRNALNALSPYLRAFWDARVTNFDTALERVRVELGGSLLHVDNPYNLTRAELRICYLIADGQKPKAMAKTLDTSMTTIRTHLRHIYAKTGLDGMFGVLHHLQMFSEMKDDTA